MTVLLWGSGFPLTTIALRSLDPASLAAFRIAVAASLMGIWLLHKRPVRPTMPDLGLLSLSGLIGIALFSLSLHTGQLTVSASATSFIVNTVPVITALLAAVTFGERLRPSAWLCSSISLGGIALIASGQPGGLKFGAGSMCIVGAALCQATYFILQRQLIQRYGAGTCVPVMIISAAMGLSPWLPAAVPQLASASATTLLAAVALGVLPAAIGNSTWSIAQSHFGPSRAANFLYLVPLVAMGLAYFLTGERPTYITLTGGVVALGGVILFNMVQMKGN